MGLDGAPQPPNLAMGFARHPRRPRRPRTSRGKHVVLPIIIAIIMGAILILPGMMAGDHIVNIERNAGSDNEMDAIMAAEKMDMASVLGIERFGRSSFGGFRWANVTDRETIVLYRDLIEEMARGYDSDDASLEYVADCHHVDRLLLFPSKEYWDLAIVYTAVFLMRSSNPNAEFEGQRRYLDLDDLPHVKEGYLLMDAYIIRQRLTFDLMLSDEYHQTIDQLVILDGDLNLRVLMVDPEYREIPICR